MASTGSSFEKANYLEDKTNIHLRNKLPNPKDTIALFHMTWLLVNTMCHFELEQ